MPYWKLVGVAPWLLFEAVYQIAEQDNPALFATPERRAQSAKAILNIIYWNIPVGNH